jgi:hypothetical protein
MHHTGEPVALNTFPRFEGFALSFSGHTTAQGRFASRTTERFGTFKTHETFAFAHPVSCTQFAHFTQFDHFAEQDKVFNA